MEEGRHCLAARSTEPELSVIPLEGKFPARSVTNAAHVAEKRVAMSPIRNKWPFECQPSCEANKLAVAKCRRGGELQRVASAITNRVSPSACFAELSLPVPNFV
jgi:hypothetical protein